MINVSIPNTKIQGLGRRTALMVIQCQRELHQWEKGRRVCTLDVEGAVSIRTIKQREFVLLVDMVQQLR